MRGLGINYGNRSRQNRRWYSWFWSSCRARGMLLIAIISQMLRGISGVSSWQNRKGQKMLRVYLSAGYHQKEKMRAMAANLRLRGLLVVSNWINEPDGIKLGDLREDQCREIARRDLQDVMECDVLVHFPGYSTGGKDVELGYALSVAKEVLIVGKPQHIFHWHPEVIRMDTWRDALEHLVSLSESSLEWLENGGTE